MKRTLIAVGVVIALALPLLALAERSELVDPDDTRGVLDVRRVVFNDGEVPRWSFVTFATWTADRTWDRGYALVNLDTFGDARFDYYVLVRSNGYKMIGELFRDRRKKGDYQVGGLKVWRKNKHSVTVKLPLAKMEVGTDRLHYRWVAKTLMTSNRCKAVCIDRIPDTGVIQTLLPGVVPTPSPTAVPSPTESPSPTPTP